MTQRQPRFRDPGYLAFLRKQRCACGCLQPAPCDAAHIRSGNFLLGKPHTGMAEKPDDCWALPLKHAHHMAQHAYGDERGWWAAMGHKDPFALALAFYAVYLKDECAIFLTGFKAVLAHVDRERAAQMARRAPRKIAARKPAAKRQKIKSRGFEGSRPFPKKVK